MKRLQTIAVMLTLITASSCNNNKTTSESSQNVGTEVQIESKKQRQ